MSHSRIDKLILSRRGFSSLASAEATRQLGFHLILPSVITLRVRVMARSAIALALRTVKGDITVTDGFTQEGTDAKSILTDLVEEAATYGEPGRLKIGVAPDGIAMRMSIGVAVDNAVIADASGWNCAVNQVLPPAENTAAPAATLAVAFAFAKLFNHHILKQNEAFSEKWMFSLESYSTMGTGIPPKRLELGNISLLGAGAIGSATIFVLKNSGWLGDVDIIDFDSYDRPNEETTLVVGIPEILRNRHKAISLAALGRTPELSISSRVRRIEGAGDEILQQRRDSFLCAVDNAETRRLLDDVNAGVALNAAVGGERSEAGHVLWTRHLKTDRPLSSFYPLDLARNDVGTDPIPEEISDLCSRVAYQNISFAAPFMALAAGSLLTAGCAHRALARWPDTNNLKFDLFGYQSKYKR